MTANIGDVDPLLQADAAAQHHIIFRPQLLDAGYTDDEIWRRRRAGEWVAVRRGAYMDQDLWESLDAVERHRVTAFAVVHQLKTPAVPSHQTAAVLMGIPVWGVDLETVHVTRADLHASRMEAGVVHHAAGLPERDLYVADGLTVTGPERTAVDVAREAPFEAGVVVADGALRRTGNHRDRLLETMDRMRTWQGARTAGRVVAFADGAAESVGESRARVQFERVGLPRPRLQPEIRGDDGDVYRADFLFEDEQTLAEFDGRVKYERYVRSGEEPADVLWREKRREDALRGAGYGLVRLTWADLDRDHVVRERFRAAFRRSSRRRGGVPVD